MYVSDENILEYLTQLEMPSSLNTITEYVSQLYKLPEKNLTSDLLVALESCVDRGVVLKHNNAYFRPVVNIKSFLYLNDSGCVKKSASKRITKSNSQRELEVSSSKTGSLTSKKSKQSPSKTVNYIAINPVCQTCGKKQLKFNFS